MYYVINLRLINFNFMKKYILYLLTVLVSSIGFSQTGPTWAWVGDPIADNTELTIGTSYTFSITYDAGDDGNGVDFLVADTNKVQFSIQEVTDGTPTKIWRAGKNDGNSGGTHEGTSTVNWTIPNLPLSADLDAGHYYVLQVGYKNNQNSWASGPANIPITIAASTADSWSWNPTAPTYDRSSTLDVVIKYTSDTDIAKDGIKFTMWTITEGPFSDIWHGAFTNPSILPAGVDQTATITINVPNTVKGTDGNIRPSSDLGANWDPNAGDVNNSYIDHANTPATNYFFQFRAVDANDANFDPLLPSHTSFTVTNTLSVNEFGSHRVVLYPNPTSDKLQLSNHEDYKALSIFNLVGQQVRQVTSNYIIDVSDLIPGVYFIRSNTGATASFIKR